MSASVSANDEKGSKWTTQLHLPLHNATDEHKERRSNRMMAQRRREKKKTMDKSVLMVQGKQYGGFFQKELPSSLQDAERKGRIKKTKKKCPQSI